MLAARFHGQTDIRIEKVPIPVCGSGQVKIRPAYVGICGTDVHEYVRGATLIPTDPHPLTGQAVPLTLGHEISGVVHEVGAGVTGLQVGQKVAVQPIIPDGTCGPCKVGKINRCMAKGFYGLSADGGAAEFLVVSAANVKVLPDGVSLEDGALVESLSVGWHAAAAIDADPKVTALVIGAGPIGLAVIQSLKARGAEQIIAADVSTTRRKFAAHFGAHRVLDPARDDVVGICRELTHGEGVDIAYDTAGLQLTLDQALAATRPGATIVNIAIWNGTAEISPNALVMTEKILTSSGVYTEKDFEAVIDAIHTGLLKPHDMITKKVPLGEIVSRGMQGLIEDKENQIKILVALHED